MAKYSAPALSKGLSILEILSEQKQPISLQNIASNLQVGVSQIYRILQVLQQSGYVIKDSSSDGYALSPKLFLLGIRFRDNSTLLDAIMPTLEEISTKTHQSCHFAIQTDRNISVIARSHPDITIGFFVKIGHTCTMEKANSGMVILAFLSEEKQQSILGDKFASYKKTFEKIRRRHFYLARSYYTQEVIDISIPVFSNAHQNIIGAITLSYMNILGNPVSFKEIIKFLRSKNPCYIL